MKRAIWPLLLFLVCIMGFLTMKGAFPLVPVSGSSMEPALRHGSLLVIKTLEPGDIKVDDIIICNVPAAAREYYHYPPVIIRRVIAISAEPSLLFRTRGDNAAEDPFPISPGDIRGIAGGNIPYLGLVPLLFQNWLWLLLVLLFLALLAVFLYRREISYVIARTLRLSPDALTDEEKIATRAPLSKKENIIKPANTAAPPRPHLKNLARKAPKPFLATLKKAPPHPKRPKDEELTDEALAARREIYDALDRLHRGPDKPKGQE